MLGAAFDESHPSQGSNTSSDGGFMSEPTHPRQATMFFTCVWTEIDPNARVLGEESKRDAGVLGSFCFRSDMFKVPPPPPTFLQHIIENVIHHHSYRVVTFIHVQLILLAFTGWFQLYSFTSHILYAQIVYST